MDSLASEPLTQYAKYVRQRYADDPEFRAKTLEMSRTWVERQLRENTEQYRQRRAASSRAWFQAHPERKQKMCEYQRMRYQAKKLERQQKCQDVGSCVA